VEDTNIGLVAAHSTDTNDSNDPTVGAEVILINKASGKFMLVEVGSEKTSTHEGSCQIGK
jgi:hypothetical protein